VTATASGFDANENVEVFFQGQLVGQQVADSGGVAVVQFDVPSDASSLPGSFTVSAEGQTSARSAEQLFSVSA